MPSTIELAREGAIGIERIIALGRELRATDVDVRPDRCIDYTILNEIVHTDFIADDALIAELEGFVDLKPARELTPEGYRENKRAVVRGAKTLADGSRIRVHKYPTSNPNGVSFALRYLEKDVPDRHVIGIPEIFYQRVKQAKGGLFGVTGPTGSGKTTTLNSTAYSLAKEVAKKIVMLDQPIEYELNDEGLLGSITQTEMPTDYLRGEDALETFMRIRPHYIFVGEVTSHAMMVLVLQLCESGHTVGISTHTDNAAETIGKIASFFPLDEQPAVYHVLARKLIACMSQRLVVNKEGNGFEMIPDLMITTPAIAKLIRDQNLSDVQQQLAHDDKQIPLNRSLFEAVFEKETITIEAAVDACDDRKEFADYCESKGKQIAQDLLDAA